MAGGHYPFRGVVCFLSTIFVFTIVVLNWQSSSPNLPEANHPVIYGKAWEKAVKKSCKVRPGGRHVVLVTGAAGFVGFHVSQALKRRGDGLIGLDNFNDYYPVTLKRARAALLEKEGVMVINADLNDRKLLEALFKLVKFTHVMNLAAQAGVRYAVHKPMTYVHSNVAGFVSLLEECKNANPKPAVVYASSSSVYGLNTKVPFSEEDATDHPASLYAATKKANEMLAHTYNHIWGLSLTGLRFFTVYGPWGRPDMAYFSFTRNIVENKPISIFQGPGGVELSRDFTYIDDVVKGCLASIDTAEQSLQGPPRGNPPPPFRIFNLGNTNPVPVSEFVSILEKHLKMKAIRNYVDMPATGDVPITHANVSRARDELGYEPVTELYTGLKHFVKWYKKFFLTEEFKGTIDLGNYKPF
ncbi:hypothetical protein CBR_g54790 [Chara braunii]|uniref:UDP-glucuronate 4-epimerase n=1 Tax=Chara braunii TaxID=69332 RepID=A0A388JPH0_CHABU|nr:hypothetical protein CBR_g54790 [Chara braunii]|eukprot:GBG59685.1 hypothetical protein CBR_g54790 [Chara braunii]